MFYSLKPGFKTLFAILALSLILVPELTAQTIGTEVISAGGESAEVNSELMLTWTIGEASVESYADGTLLVVEGFHQPLLKISPLKNFSDKNDAIAVFPNPTVDFITIKLPADVTIFASGKKRVELRDIIGKLVYEAAIEGDEHKIDMQLLANGTYIVTIVAEDNPSIMGSYKIEKFK